MPILPSSPSVLWRPNRETETALSRVPPHFPHRSAAPREGAIMASRFLFSLPSPQPRRRRRRRRSSRSPSLPSDDDSRKGGGSEGFSQYNCVLKERNGRIFRDGGGGRRKSGLIPEGISIATPLRVKFLWCSWIHRARLQLGRSLP